MSKTSRTKLSVFLAAGIAAVILAAALSVFYGSTKIPFETVLQALRAPDMTDQQQIIIHELRIPRTIGCILVGAAFAVAGAIMQGVTRNPLADSGLLGINAGASFALAVCLAFLPSLSFSGVVLFSFLGAAVAMVVVCVLQGVSRNEMAEPGILGINAGAGLFIAAYIVLFSGSSVTYSILLPILAFAGSICTAAVDYFLSLTRQGLSPRRLLLVGIAMSTAISSATTMLMLRMSDSEYAFVQNWLSGSIWGANWQNVTLLTIGLALLLLAVFYKSRTLNVLVLGQQTATGLGVDVPRQTVLLLAAAIGMSSLCCSVGGGLSFVGLVCPHLARRLVGPNYRVLLGTTVLTGGVLMVFSDIISRTLLSPNEIPIGIVAAVIGAPYFLYLLVKS